MDALVRELMPYVGRVCGAIALDRGDDAMQETFISVLRNLATLREPAALYGWVRRIAVREAIRAARRGHDDPVDPAMLLSVATWSALLHGSGSTASGMKSSSGSCAL